MIKALQSVGFGVGDLALDGLSAEDRQQRKVNRLVLVLVVDGAAVSGAALLLGLADLVIMTDVSYAFVSGPAMVADFTDDIERISRL